MKLSEAIRLGAMLRPQVRGDYFWMGASCALGAALEAVGVARPGDHVCLADVLHCFPILRLRINGGPCLSGSIALLNDDYGWTREQIADWVETIEAQQEQEAGSERGVPVHA